MIKRQYRYFNQGGTKGFKIILQHLNKDLRKKPIPCNVWRRLVWKIFWTIFECVQFTILMIVTNCGIDASINLSILSIYRNWVITCISNSKQPRKALIILLYLHIGIKSLSACMIKFARILQFELWKSCPKKGGLDFCWSLALKTYLNINNYENLNTVFLSK